MLICDEITSALDTSVQGSVLELLSELQSTEHHGLGLLVITRDLNVVRRVADRILVPQNGSICEHGTVDEVLENPQDPVTCASSPTPSHWSGPSPCEHCEKALRESTANPALRDRKSTERAH